MSKKKNASGQVIVPQKPKQGKFHLEFKNSAQKMAFSAFQQHDILFLIGPAGTGKTHLAMAFAINELLLGNKTKIVLTRPIVEAGESLGYLPGDFNEKVLPYMLPLYDCLKKTVGEGDQRDRVNKAIEVAPLAYMRGRTFDDAICIFDEAQNATHAQLKLFLTRLGENSKMIVTGDPTQSDIGNESGLGYVFNKLSAVPGIAAVEFSRETIVRHPLVGSIIEKLGED